MRKRNPTRILIALLLAGAFLLGAGTAPTPVEAINLGGSMGDLVKIFGIGWVVNRFAGQINTTINRALAQQEAEIAGYTKVVPIVRLVGGGGQAIGAAQVMGTKAQVDQVRAVAEVELRLLGSTRARGLVPISNPTSLSIVNGVGISANIKFPL